MDVSAGQSSPKKTSRVLRSIMLNKDQQRHGLQRTATNERDVMMENFNTQSVPLLPPDHPHAEPRVVDEDARWGRRSKKENVEPHKRSKSTVSLRSLGRSKDGDKDKDKDKKSRKERQAHADMDEGRKKPKKTKSTTSLRGLLTKSRSSKNLKQDAQVQHDKENLTPEPVDTPIWSQFATADHTTENNQDQPKHIQDEIARYTPRDYTPSKQRDFAAPPTLSRPVSSSRPELFIRPATSDRPQSSDRPSSSGRPSSSSRPKSALLPTSTSFGDALARKISGHRSQLQPSGGDRARPPSSSGKESQRPSIEHSTSYFQYHTDRNVSNSSTEQGPSNPLNIAKRGSRVMAAVAALNGKANQTVPLKGEAKLDPKAVDADFEAVLNARNIPENMRQKMRTLTLRVKADFIKQDRGASTPLSPTKTTSRPCLTSKETFESSAVPEVTQPSVDMSTESKKSRARSKTFTFTKSDSSPVKKQKSERPNSIHITSSTTSVPLASPRISSGASARGGQPAAPEDFVTYLRTVRDPTQCEVGRLHKLRLLLRNETVAWVDLFISLGGMTEVVDLLHRIMAIEWREEHEDQLLHETLLCLKGLCTTEVALAKLEDMADSLFPSLLGLIFDEEKKGPSEFNTRAIIVNVLFAYLTAARDSPPNLMAQRARSVLGYLMGPKKPVEAQPVHFVLDMRQPRPYRVWCHEVNSVTREVFWIFLHHLNIIPLPSGENERQQSSDTEDQSGALRASAAWDNSQNLLSSQAMSYTKRHFPGDRPPVPAAPYIGGVEWDATTYITAHLDLLNGLIASLPTREERNGLRDELKTSGWEKVMGTTLRTCKEKFYCGVHSGLQSWVAGALEDGWNIEYVRYGPTQEELAAMSPRKSPKKSEPPPKLDSPILDVPKLDLGFGGTAKTERGVDLQGEDDGWLM